MFGRRRPCWVYIVDAIATDYVKVGETTDLDQRIADGRTWNHSPLAYYDTWKLPSKSEARAVETVAHDLLAQWRADGGREWFGVRPSDAADAVKQAARQVETSGWFRSALLLPARYHVRIARRRAAAAFRVLVVGFAAVGVLTVATVGWSAAAGGGAEPAPTGAGLGGVRVESP